MTVRAAHGSQDGAQLQIAADYLYGGFLGTRAWRKALNAANRQSEAAHRTADRVSRDPGGGGPSRCSALVAAQTPQVSMPMIVTHGWPGSIIEQLKIIDPLTDPDRAWRERGGPSMW